MTRIAGGKRSNGWGQVGAAIVMILFCFLIKPIDLQVYLGVFSLILLAYGCRELTATITIDAVGISYRNFFRKHYLRWEEIEHVLVDGESNLRLIGAGKVASFWVKHSLDEVLKEIKSHIQIEPVYVIPFKFGDELQKSWWLTLLRLLVVGIVFAWVKHPFILSVFVAGILLTCASYSDVRMPGTHDDREVLNFILSIVAFMLFYNCAIPAAPTALLALRNLLIFVLAIRAGRKVAVRCMSKFIIQRAVGKGLSLEVKG